MKRTFGYSPFSCTTNEHILTCSMWAPRVQHWTIKWLFPSTAYTETSSTVKYSQQWKLASTIKTNSLYSVIKVYVVFSRRIFPFVKVNYQKQWQVPGLFCVPQWYIWSIRHREGTLRFSLHKSYFWEPYFFLLMWVYFCSNSFFKNAF